MLEGHKPKMTLLQAEEMVHDLREHIIDEDCSMSTQMKLNSFLHDIQKERMERPTTAPSLHWFLPEKRLTYFCSSIHLYVFNSSFTILSRLFCHHCCLSEMQCRSHPVAFVQCEHHTSTWG